MVNFKCNRKTHPLAGMRFPSSNCRMVKVTLFQDITFGGDIQLDGTLCAKFADTDALVAIAQNALLIHHRNPHLLEIHTFLLFKVLWTKNKKQENKLLLYNVYVFTIDDFCL